MANPNIVFSRISFCDSRCVQVEIVDYVVEQRSMFPVGNVLRKGCKNAKPVRKEHSNGSFTADIYTNVHFYYS